MERIARRYGLPGALDAIFDGLRAEDKDVDRLVADDLAPVDEMLEERGEGPPPNLGLHLLIGQTAPATIRNVARNLREERIAVAMAALRKDQR